MEPATPTQEHYSADDVEVPNALDVRPSAFPCEAYSPYSDADSARNNNTRSARRAAAAFEAYVEVHSDAHKEDARTTFEDMFLDFCHLADACGIDLCEVIQDAHTGYQEEIDGGGDRRAHRIRCGQKDA